MPRPYIKAKHGRVAMYSYHGCRCDTCKTAASAYRAKYYTDPISGAKQRKARRENVKKIFKAQPGYNAAALKKKQEKRKAARLCPDCGVSMRRTARIYCSACTARKNSYKGRK